MSKSLKRVTRALEEAGLDSRPMEMGAETRTAQQAAQAAGCELDQIAKSIIFLGEDSGETYLFLTAGGRQVVAEKARAVAGETLARADAAAVRAGTGFAIGGVSPIGLTGAVRMFLDPRLLEFDVVWAAAGTPRHIFPIAPGDLQALTGAPTGDFAA